jgi:amino-acid N-acetyltransferase
MGPPAIAVRPSVPADDARVRALLESAGLPAADVQTGRQEYLLALEGERLVGAVGLEVVGKDGLLRSLAVAPDRRGRGIAGALHEQVVALARRRGVEALYLLTTTAEAYAARRGFERVHRSDAPPGLQALAQFRTLCPATAVCMRTRIERPG